MMKSGGGIKPSPDLSLYTALTKPCLWAILYAKIRGRRGSFYAMIGVSFGTAAVMGLIDARMCALPTTAYLMLGGRCVMDCAFCAQARSSFSQPHRLSRIIWPPFDERDVISRLETSTAQGRFKRICIQVTVTQGYVERTIELVKELKERCSVPVDVAILPRSMNDVDALFNAGVEHIGFGLDAVCERVFREVKGGHWKATMRLIEQAAWRYPGRIAVHFIIGLGETEREAAFAIQGMHDLGVIVGLFAFTPLKGTKLAERNPPPLDSYRRIQAARWLITKGIARAEDFAYSSQGRIVALHPAHWKELLSDGQAFMTSGCPDCNRPYYNERPSGPLYNYPHSLSTEEARQALRETGL